MTTANLLNISAVKGPQVDVSKKLQEEASEVSEIFACMMNQTVGTFETVQGDESCSNTVSKTENVQSVNDSYERYSYKDNHIDSAREDVSPEDLEMMEETAQQVEEEIMDTLGEAYGVDEETIQGVLDELGLSVFDLLNPKNLVSFVMALTDVSTSQELLLDENFLKIMETMEQLSNNLMKEWSVDTEGLQDIISQMEMITEEILSTEYEDVQNAQMNILENGEEVIDSQASESVVSADTVSNAQDTSNEQASADTSEVKTEVVTENEQGTTSTEAVSEVEKNSTMPTEEVADEEAVAVVEELVVEEDETTLHTEDSKTDAIELEVTKISADTEKDLAFSGKDNSKNNSFLRQDSNPEQVFVTASSATQSSPVDGMSQMQLGSYVSVDTTQILQQIAEQIRVVVTPDTTSMEMQLNPENLGRIYLNISSEEGVVNAQFIATSEVVKEALEAQLATLRENLNQAGVKVDAIEVTVESHAFEKNLEQNQKDNSQEFVQEQKEGRRRNLTAETLDELAGVMTEEETLVAQIMKDNGNTVDFTA